MARAGVGKTACLIHIAFDKLFRKEKLVHVSLEDVPEKITSYYNVIFYDLVKALHMDDEYEVRMLLEALHMDDEYEVRMLLERNRMILAYLQQSFEIKRLTENLKNLVEKIDFVPDTLIVDGVDFEKAGRDVFQGFKGIADQFKVEIWFSARTHRHITDVNERGIPYPCHELDDLFNIIIQLLPTQSGIVLRLLKDHDAEVKPDASVRLDPCGNNYQTSTLY
jgi:hypothetical protein